MSDLKKYTLGNQVEEYELSEKYLGWKPVGYKNWIDFIWERAPHTQTLVTLLDSKTCETADIIMFKVFDEYHSLDWNIFALVSKKEGAEQFIIPLH